MNEFDLISVPEVLTQCSKFVEDHGLVDGIYRISGVASNIKRLKALFDTQTVPDNLHKEDWIQQDLHCVPSLIKLFFRELPDPMCTEGMFPLLKKGAAIAALNSDSREALPCFKEAVKSLSLKSDAHLATLRHLMLHLQRVSLRSKETGMSSKNLAIVWAPNLIRTPFSHQSIMMDFTESSEGATR